MAEEKPQADVEEQAESPTGAAAAEGPTMPEQRMDGSEADVLEQAMVVEEGEVLRPEGSKDAASEGDWLEQSMEETSGEESERR